MSEGSVTPVLACPDCNTPVLTGWGPYCGLCLFRRFEADRLMVEIHSFPGLWVEAGDTQDVPRTTLYPTD